MAMGYREGVRRAWPSPMLECSNAARPNHSKLNASLRKIVLAEESEGEQQTDCGLGLAEKLLQRGERVSNPSPQRSCQVRQLSLEEL